MTAAVGVDPLEELRHRTPLRPLIERHVRLQRDGNRLKGCCPFHAEKTPSFFVWPDHFHCFGCGAHGNAITFTMRVEGLDFPEAVAQLAADAGMAAAPAGNREQQRERAARLARERAGREARRAAVDSAEEAERIATVRRRVARTGPIAGTIAERYLVETRGIPCPPGGWPDASPLRRAGRGPGGGRHRARRRAASCAVGLPGR
jgi:hypothetical protein